MPDRRKLVIIDANSLIYRAYFALPHLTNSRGEVTNAIYGFITMLFKVLDEEHPELMAVAFDLPGPTFRHDQFSEYKAHRAPMPDELAPQLQSTREVLEALRIPTLESPGYEADDVIGAVAMQAEAVDCEVVVVTGDLDALQLVSDQTSVTITRRGITDTVKYDRKAVLERFALEPVQLADYKALRGDPSDNIPNVPGVGEKTAQRLIREHGSLEALMASLDALRDRKLAAALSAYEDQTRRNKVLVTIDRAVPVEVDWEQCQVRPPDREHLLELFRRFEFKSLLPRLGIEPEQRTAEAIAITSLDQLDALIENSTQAGQLALVTLTQPGPGPEPVVVGLGLGLPTGQTAFMLTQAPQGILATPPMRPDVWERLKPVLEDERVAKLGHNLKPAYSAFSKLDIELRGVVMDSMVASYLLNPARQTHSLEAIAFDQLQIPPSEQRDWADAWRSGDPEGLAQLACGMADLISRLAPVLAEKLEAQGLTKVFCEIELPLTPVLAEMERTGVAVDQAYLGELSANLGSQAGQLERDIYALAGEEFTINSPKQLQRILFEKLGMRPTKRTKTGYSTDAEVLSQLAEEYEIVRKVLEYRELSKLKSTYADALGRLINPTTGRVHTTFNQTVTATGRLSSSDPNLQNIPIRTEVGRQIRQAFVAGQPDHLLLAADYSQIELRVLAEIADEPALIEIFQRDEDLHTATAAEIFAVEPKDVTYDMRRLAKVVNFAIPYGTSDFGLARSMGVSQSEAAAYMERYFHRFPRVKEYMQQVVEQARAAGYVTTLLGRRRPLPDLRTASRSLREFAERTAINTPIQGSAADIIKLAMLSLWRTLKEQGRESRLILQVHDELVLEIPESERAIAGELVIRCMTEAYPLRVPLKVEAEIGKNWNEMTPL